MTTSTSATEAKVVGRLPGVPGRVIGIDPGLHVTGYAVVDPSPNGPYVVEAGILRPKGILSETMGGRLRLIHEGVVEVLDAFPASTLAIEQIHSHVRHPRTSILMAHARGVIILAASLRDIPVAGYAATRIKKTLTGSGRASKDQMQHAIQTELGLSVLPEPHDVADACAVALCHFQIAKNMRAIEGF